MLKKSYNNKMYRVLWLVRFDPNLYREVLGPRHIRIRTNPFSRTLSLKSFAVIQEMERAKELGIIKSLFIKYGVIEVEFWF